MFLSSLFFSPPNLGSLLGELGLKQAYSRERVADPPAVSGIAIQMAIPDIEISAVHSCSQYIFTARQHSLLC